MYCRTLLEAPRGASGLLLGCVLALLAIPGASSARRPAATPVNAPAPSDEVGRQLTAQLARQPLHFEANQGQAGPEVRFVARGGGYALFLTGSEAVLALQPERRSGRQSDGGGAVLRMRLVGSDAAAVAGLERQRGKSHHFLGDDPARWRRDLAHYGRVRYSAVYPGIDLDYYGNQGQLEYDFSIASGADPRRIRLAFAGADRICLDRQGDLVLKIPGGAVRQPKPVAYQVVDGQRRVVQAGYRLVGARRARQRKAEGQQHVAFTLGQYDRSQRLVIDPVLSYSSYLGGAGFDSGNGIAVDPATGHAYVTGQTFSIGYATTAGAFQPNYRGSSDAFVARFDPSASGAASLLYSTFLGGTGFDLGASIAIDAGGNAYVTGQTSSNNFPTTAGAFRETLLGSRDAFVSRLNSVGSALDYSTYLGGSGFDIGNGIAASSSPGVVFATGQTFSADFAVAGDPIQPIIGGNGDAFLIRVDTNAMGVLSLPYSTFLGGAGADNGLAVAGDGATIAWLTGETSSLNFPRTASAFQGGSGGGADAFITQVDTAAGAAGLIYSTYLGGSSTDNGRAIAVGPGSDAFVTGPTISLNFPRSAGALDTSYNGAGDAFVARVDGDAAGAASLSYSTFLGGSGADAGNGIAVDALGNAFLAGQTQSSNFPLVEPIQATRSALNDLFISKLDPAGGSLLFSTFLGNTGDDQGRAVGIDGAGRIYATGLTSSGAFPTTGNAFDTTHNGVQDAFLIRLTEGETVQFITTNYIIDEAAGTVSVTVTRAGSAAGPASVEFATSPGSATSPEDYTHTTGTVDFPAGETSDTFTVPIFNDGSAENDEFFNVTLLNPSPGLVLGTPFAATVTIVDNDGAGNFQFSAANFSVNESAGTVTITVTRSGGAVGAASVQFNTSNGTATTPSDYQSASGTLFFASGDVSETFTVAIVDNNIAEANETFSLTLSNPVGGTLGSQRTATVTIVDNDGAGTLQFGATDFRVNESDGSATVTITRTGGSAGTARVSFATSNGTALSGSDYTRTVTTVNFASGETGRSINVPIRDDDVAEPDETINLTLSGAAGATLGTPRLATITIADDDSPGSLQFSQADFVASEQNGTALIVVNRVGGSAGEVRVTFRTSNGTATAVSDYEAVNQQLIFLDGEVSKGIEVTIVNDDRAEPDETVNLTLSDAVGGATLGTPFQATLTILDNDSPGTLQFSAATYRIGEGGGSVAITVTRIGGAAGEVRVNFTTRNGTASAGADYDTTSGQLTFADGETSKTFFVPIVQDALSERDETVLLSLSNPTGGAALGVPRSATLTIADDDRPGTLQFSQSTFRVDEDAGSVTITVTRSGSTGAPASVRFTTNNGTARANQDYTSLTGTLDFVPGEITKTFIVLIVNDTNREADETFTLTLSNPVGAGLGTPRTASVVIADDDGPGTLQFSQATYTVDEGGGTLTVTVTRTGGSNGGVSVRFTTRNGDATSPADYESNSGTLNFGPGETIRAFTVQINEDSRDEPDETFRVQLSNPAGGARLGSLRNSVVTIIDNDL